MQKTFIILSMLILFAGTSYSQGNVKKIISYNVLEGLQQDSVNQQRFVKWIREIDPDVVAFQEMNKFTQKSLENLAREYNHPYAILSRLDGYPVSISSKYPVVNVQKVVDNMWHAYIYANIDNIHFFVIHFSPHSLKKRLEEVNLILAHAKTLPEDEPILIMGDFNSMDRSDAGQYDDAMVEGMRKREREQTHIRNLNNGEIDYTVMDRLKHSGFIDTFWLTNKTFKPSITTPRFGTPSRRIDFIWANKTAADKVVNGTILHDEQTNIMSDHYPVYIELDFSK